MNSQAKGLIATLGLLPHPEGGFYRETHRASQEIQSLSHEGKRSAYTSIYYLLSQDQYSAWHRITSDESWFFHAGCDLEIFSLSPAAIDSPAQLRSQKIGPTSQQFQVTVPANTWFAAKPVDPSRFALVSCVVAPGFEFSDFELASQQTLAMEGFDRLKEWDFVKTLLAS